MKSLGAARKDSVGVNLQKSEAASDDIMASEELRKGNQSLKNLTREAHYLSMDGAQDHYNFKSIGDIMG